MPNLPYNESSPQTYRSNSVNNGPSEPGECVDSLPDSITLIPSLYAKYLLTCIGTYNIDGTVKSLINKFLLTNKTLISGIRYTSRFNNGQHSPRRSSKSRPYETWPNNCAIVRNKNFNFFLEEPNFSNINQGTKWTTTKQRNRRIENVARDDVFIWLNLQIFTLHLTAMLIASEGRRSKLIHSDSSPT